MIAIFIDWLKAFAQRCTVHWGHLVVDVVECIDGLTQLFNIKSTSISSSLALSQRTLEPDHSIQATLNEELGRFFFTCGLNKQESFLHFVVTCDWVQLLSRLETAHGLFQELGLSIIAREIDKNPACSISDSQSFKFVIKAALLSFQDLNLLLFEVFLL